MHRMVFSVILICLIIKIKFYANEHKGLAIEVSVFLEAKHQKYFTSVVTSR
jgi:hypothetical protein